MTQETDVKNLTESLQNRFRLSSVADEVLAALGEKTAAENTAIDRVLTAVTEVIASRGETVTYPTLLSGLVATLEAKDAIEKAQICSAVCSCLTVVVRRVPKAILSLQAARLISIDCTILKRHVKNFSIQKSVLSSLPRIVASLDSSSVRSVQMLLDVMVPAMAHAECRGTARLAAQGVAAILKLEMFGELKSEVCSRIEQLGWEVVEAPLKKAAVASTVSDSKTRSKMQDALDSAVLSLMQFLTALPALLPLTHTSFIVSILPQIWKILTIGLPQISAMACDVLRALFDHSSAIQLERETVEDILLVLIQYMEGPQKESHDLSLAFVETVYTGFMYVQNEYHTVSLEVFSRALPLYLRQLLSEFEELRERSKQHLVSLFSMMAKGISAEGGSLKEGDAEGGSPISRICQCIEAATETDQEDDLIALLPVVKSLFVFLGHRRAGHARKLLARLGSLYEACDAQSSLERSCKVKPPLLKRLEESIGSAISCLGVSAVLDVLPLEIQEALERRTNREPRTWLLPMIKKYSSSDLLSCWMEILLPAAERARHAAQEHSISDHKFEFKCLTLEKQIWQTLPSFCLWARDIPSNFEPLSHIMAQTFVERNELRETIFLAIHQLYCHPQQALKAHQMRGIAMDSEDGLQGSCSTSDTATDIPEHFTLELAEQSVEVLQNHSAKWFEILASVFVTTGASKGPNLLSALSKLASISTPTTLNTLFSNAKNRLFQSFQDASSGNVQQQMISFDLLFAIGQSLDNHGLEEMIRIAELVIQSDVQYHLQKKGYKILAYILSQRPTAWLQKSSEMAMLLESTCDYCQPASLKFRLQCIKEFLSSQFSQNPPLMDINELVVMFLPEIVMGLVDSGAKTKETVKQTLLQIGQHYSENGRFDILIALVQASLSSEDVLMVTGAIKAIQHLMEHFGVLFSEKLAEILEILLQLIKDREQQMSSAPTVSVLMDFLKTASQNLPRMVLSRYTEAIVRVALEWDAPMKKAREQTKALLMQLSELMGFEEVQRFVPEAYSRVMRNLRKLQRRSASQMEQTDDGKEAGGSSRMAKSLTNKTASQAASSFKPGTAGQSLLSKKSIRSRSVALSDTDAMEEAVDLLNPSESRRLAKAAAGQMADNTFPDTLEESSIELPVNSEGKLVINEKSLKKAEKELRKRRRESLEDSEYDDAITLRSGTQLKKSVVSRSGKSKTSRTKKPSTIKSHHSGKRFKSKKGAGGDVKGASKFEPYAYWKLDRHLLNKRRGKRNAARRDLKQMNRFGRNSV